VLPEGKTPPQRNASGHPFLRLLHLHVLKDEDRILGHPCDQRLRRDTGEVTGASGSATVQPFEDTLGATPALALCLLGHHLFLHTPGCLHRAPVAHLGRQAADEQFPPIGIDGSECVFLVQVYADRLDTLVQMERVPSLRKSASRPRTPTRNIAAMRSNRQTPIRLIVHGL